ncbi:MAG: hypothetical protein LC677_05705 [Halomonas sp.]|nr:hypothetical protein [Halomonas sp.]
MPSQSSTKLRRRGARWIGAALVIAATGVEAASPKASNAALEPSKHYWAPFSGYPVPVNLYTEVVSPLAVNDEFSRGVVIAETELDQLRAGFSLGGLDVDFGARLQTMIDNSIELVSVVNFTRAGVDIVSQTFRDPSGSVSQVGPGTGLLITDMTPGGLDLAGLAGFSGVALSDAKGFTAALQNITRDAIVSGVVSNASGRNIQQRINIDVQLNNIGALKAAKQRAAIVDSFAGILR